MRIPAALFVLFCLSAPAWAADYAPTILQQDKVVPGTVLFTDVSDPRHPKIVEVDVSGRVVWEYEPPSSLKTKPRTPLPLGDAEPLPGGHVLFTVHSKGVYEIDREGTVVWSLDDPEAAHDADRLPGGNTLYNRGWVERGEDVVREVAPDGTLVWSWNGLPAFEDERYADVHSEGWMHVNSCERLADGTTLISIRNFHTLVRVDQAGNVVWSYTFRSKGKGGDLATPEGLVVGSANHAPELTPDGTMLVAVRKPHAVYEIDLASGQAVRQWEQDGYQIIRDCNLLPGGNILVTGSDRMAEVAPDGEIVWEIKAHASPQGIKMDRPFHRAMKIGTDGTIHGN